MCRCYELKSSSGSPDISRTVLSWLRSLAFTAESAGANPDDIITVHVPGPVPSIHNAFPSYPHPTSPVCKFTTQLLHIPSQTARILLIFFPIQQNGLLPHPGHPPRPSDCGPNPTRPIPLDLQLLQLYIPHPTRPARFHNSRFIPRHGHPRRAYPLSPPANPQPHHERLVRCNQRSRRYPVPTRLHPDPL